MGNTASHGNTPVSVRAVPWISVMERHEMKNSIKEEVLL